MTRLWDNPNVIQDGKTFYQGQWRTPEAIERKREQRRARDANPEHREREYQRKSDWYWGLPGFEYNLRLLKSRRQQGVARVKARRAIATTNEGGSR